MISTNCRSCGVYLKIEKGQAIAPARFDENPRYQSSLGGSEPAPQKETPAPAPTPEPPPEPEPQSKSEADSPSPKRNLTPLPREREKLPEKKASPQIPTPPVPKETTSEEAPPAASVPRTEPRNPLPKKPAKPKAPPPPSKPEGVVEQTAPAPKAEPEQTLISQPTEKPTEKPAPEPSSERYRPQVPVTSEATKPKIAPLINREKKRDVKCFECKETHEILADSKSALCPHCGAYIGLSDYDIKDQHNSRIQTRGNVFVHKKGYITGITIHAHNLTIEGEIQGGAECTGDFIVRKNGKINGEVVSDRVIIERRAKVDFLSPVQAREVIIDGYVTGAVACKKLILKKRATLDGDLTVASLSVEEGAKHTGNIKMTGLL